MIERISEKIAIMLKEANPEETNSVAVMKYHLAIFIHLLLVFVSCLIVGLLTGKTHETLITFVSFVMIRFFSGGKHARTLEGCLIISIILIGLIPHIDVYVWLINPINIFNVCIMAVFAPLIKGVDTVSMKAKPYLKILSIVMVGLNFYFQSDIVALAFLAQSLLLIFWRR
ncbi:putative regulator protein [compost metagenome]